jgi:hypothetical protein
MREKDKESKLPCRRFFATNLPSINRNTDNNAADTRSSRVMVVVISSISFIEPPCKLTAYSMLLANNTAQVARKCDISCQLSSPIKPQEGRLGST